MWGTKHIRHYFRADHTNDCCKIKVQSTQANCSNIVHIEDELGLRSICVQLDLKCDGTFKIKYNFPNTNLLLTVIESNSTRKCQRVRLAQSALLVAIHSNVRCLLHNQFQILLEAHSRLNTQPHSRQYCNNQRDNRCTRWQLNEVNQAGVSNTWQNKLTGSTNYRWNDAKQFSV